MDSLSFSGIETDSERLNAELESNILKNLSIMTGQKISRQKASRMLRNLVKAFDGDIEMSREDMPASLQLTSEYRESFNRSFFVWDYSILSLMKGLNREQKDHALALMHYISFSLSDGGKFTHINPYIFSMFLDNKIDTFSSFEEIKKAALKTSDFSRIIESADYKRKNPGWFQSIHLGNQFLHDRALSTMDSPADVFDIIEETPEYIAAYSIASRYLYRDFSFKQLLAVEKKFEMSLENCGDPKISALVAVMTNSPAYDNPDELDESFFVKRSLDGLGYSHSNIVELFTREMGFSMISVLAAMNVGMPRDLLLKMQKKSCAYIMKFKEAMDSSGIKPEEISQSQISWVNSWLAD